MSTLKTSAKVQKKLDAGMLATGEKTLSAKETERGTEARHRRRAKATVQARWLRWGMFFNAADGWERRRQREN